MRRMCVLAALVAISPQSLAADTRDWMLLDLVRIESGAFHYDQYTICGVRGAGRNARKVQFRSKATSPTNGVVSRDQFVAHVQHFEMVVALAVVEQSRPMMRPTEAARVLDCKPLSSPIGKVDLELSLTLTEEGIQFEVLDTKTGESERRSDTWDELLDD